MFCCEEIEKIYIGEREHGKTYIKTCATREDSDQSTHQCSLIRVFAGRMCLLQPPGYPKRDKTGTLAILGDSQADLSSLVSCLIVDFVVHWLIYICSHLELWINKCPPPPPPNFSTKSCIVGTHWNWLT